MTTFEVLSQLHGIKVVRLDKFNFGSPQVEPNTERCHILRNNFVLIDWSGILDICQNVSF